MSVAKINGKNVQYDLMDSKPNAFPDHDYLGFGEVPSRLFMRREKGHFWKLKEPKFRLVSGTVQFAFKTDVGFYKVRASTVEDGRWIWVAYDGMNGPEIASKMVSSAPTQADALEWLKEIQ